MATLIDQTKLNKLVKAGKSHSQCASELGLTPGQLNMLAFGKALVEAGKLKKAPATEASAKKLRKEGLRYDFIAAATGLSTAKVKEFTDGIPGPTRGRKPGTSNGSATSGRKTAATSKTRGTNKTRGAGKKSGTSRKAGPARARTRAERAAKSGNPS